VHLFATTRGYHHHRFRFDRTGLGPDGRLRLTFHLAWRQWLNDGYWGLGNRTTRQADHATKRYRYTLFQPFSHTTLRAELDGPWSIFGSLNAKWSEVRTYDGSLLAEQRPFGMDGGLTTLVSGGVVYDTRRPETTPAGGLLLEVSGRYTPPLPHGAGTFGGGFVSARGYVSVASWAVLAIRGMTERLVGDVPFYELVHWGGWTPISGFGGSETLRGVPFGRWRGPGKAVFNAELRLDVARHSLLGSPMRWQVVPYADAGFVYGTADGGGAASDLPIHPAAGAGVRAIYDEAFVGRVDTGFGLDAVRRDDTVAHEPAWGLYVVFDHTY